MTTTQVNVRGGERRIVLTLALVARLIYFITTGPYDRFLTSGDSMWYIQNSWFIFHNALPTTLSSIGPLYPLIMSGAWAIFPGVPYPTGPESVPITFLFLIRLIQIALSLLMVRFSYQLTYRLTGKHRPSLIAAIGMGLGPAFIAEPFHILTETLFMALLVLGIWFYITALDRQSAGQFAAAGFAFGLAALTRPVLLLFPFCLVPHFIIRSGSQFRKAFLGVFLGMFLITLLPWSAYLHQGTGSWVPQGFFSNLWIGSFGSGKFVGSSTLDELRQGFEESNIGYASEAARNIGADPASWLLLRVRNTAEALLQPHGTDNLPDYQIKLAFINWMRNDRSVEGFLALISVPGFLDKLAIYFFHYAALAFGMIGVWYSLKEWRKFYVPLLTIPYFIGLYGLLTVQPRYLFPTQIFFWVFAGIGMVEIHGRLMRSRAAIRQSRQM